MATEFKLVGKLSEAEFAEMTKDRELLLKKKKKQPNIPVVDLEKQGVKDKNILMNELLKIEKERFQVQQAMVNEWAHQNTRFATDVELMRQSVAQLHTFVVGKLQALPVDKDERQKLLDELNAKIDDANDTIEDAMFKLEERELEISKEEAKARRKGRDAERKAAIEKHEKERQERIEAAKAIEEARAKEEAKRAEELKIAEEFRRIEEAKRAEETKKAEEERERAILVDKAVKQELKDDALSAVIGDNEMVLNLGGLNCNLLTFSNAIARIIRKKDMLHASMARTKSGNLVIVCRKVDANNAENVRISVRDGKTCGSIVNNSFCKYIRNMYGLNDTDEYRFDVKAVAYADDIKIKINSKL